MCGGGGASGDTKYNWNDTLQPKWQDLLASAENKAYNNVYQQYPGQRIAMLDPHQSSAIAGIERMTTAGGTAPAIAANNQAESTLRDLYLTGAGKNPYAAQTNAYSGFGPTFGNVLGTGLSDITDAYQKGTAADTTRMFNLSGAFGGSAHQNAVANNEAGLGKTLNNYATGMLNDQYNRSAGLEDARLGRAASAYEGERGRQMGAIAPGQNANNMYLQGTSALMGAGDALRGLNQDYLNQAYNDWQQSRNQDFQNADWLSGIYSRAQGGMSPNSTFTQAGYQASPFSSLLGAGLAGYALTR